MADVGSRDLSRGLVARAPDGGAVAPGGRAVNAVLVLAGALAWLFMWGFLAALPPLDEPPNERLPCEGERCPCEAISCQLPCSDCCPGAQPEGCVPPPTEAR